MIAALAWVIALEATLGAVLVVLLAIRAGGMRARDASRERALAAARPILRRAVLDGADPTALEGLGERDLIHLFAELAPALSGRSRDSIHALARRLGIVASAEKRCRSVWWWRRLYAARVLTLVAAPDELLDVLLDDAHPLVRAQAAEWAGTSGEPRLTRKLVAHLDDPERIARFTIEDALVRTGMPAVAPLRELLPAMSPAGIVAGLVVAGRLADTSLLDVTVALTTHASAQVRAAAAAALGAIGGRVAIGALRQGLHDDAPEARAAAARALGKLRDWQSVTFVAPLLADRVWGVRREAALALRAMGPAGTVLLRQARRGEDAFAADIATQALGTAAEG